MKPKRKILAIVGSASATSANLKLVQHIADLTSDYFLLTIFSGLKQLPHFDPDLSAENPPAIIQAFRNSIEAADGILICTPEYVFSIPSGLKNAIEWCIATTVFSDKPVALLTASAHGQKGHEELQLIMKTAMARFTNATCLLIQGIKGKMDENGIVIHQETEKQVIQFIGAFKELVN